MRSLLYAAFLLLSQAAGGWADRPGYTTVLLYHRFDESAYPSTNISVDKFRQQMQYLRDNEYRVLSMEAFRQLLSSGKPVPQKTVLITSDDAYRSIYERAFPVLKEFDYPFTVFADAKRLYSNAPGALTWAMLEEMRAWGATIANHSYDHPRIGRPQKGHTREAYAAWVRQDLSKAQQALADHGMASDVLAYPYGEYNEVVVEIARDLGFEIMFAQDEGAVDERTDPRRIPRFAIVGKNLDMDRFVFKLNTGPLHVVDVEPDAIELAQNPPEEFSMRLLDPKRYRPGVINMFVSEWGRVDAQFDRGTGVFSYRCSTALTRPMNRLIVTAREKESGHFSMFSRPYFLPFEELGGRD